MPGPAVRARPSTTRAGRPRATRAAIAVSVAAALALLAGCGRQVPSSGVNVFAVASLAEPLARIATRFRTETGVAVRFHLLRSDALVAALLSGQTADLVVVDDDAQIDRLSAAGLVDDRARARLLGDRLVVIVPAGSGFTFQVPGDLAGPAIRRFAVSDSAAEPAGRHASAYLLSRGVWTALQPRLVRFAHARAAATAVALNTADAGLVYRSDARATPGARILVEIDADPRWPIVYAGAVLRRAARPPEARKLLDRLQQADSLALFREAGYVAPLGPDPGRN